MIEILSRKNPSKQEVPYSENQAHVLSQKVRLH